MRFELETHATLLFERKFPILKILLLLFKIHGAFATHSQIPRKKENNWIE